MDGASLTSRSPGLDHTAEGRSEDFHQFWLPETTQAKVLNLFRVTDLFRYSIKPTLPNEHKNALITLLTTWGFGDS